LVVVVLLLAVSVAMMFTGCKFPWSNDDDDDGGSPTDVANSAEPTPLPAGVLIGESLKDGTTVADYEDGTFTADGLQFTGNYWHLKYTIPTTPRGYIEFNAKGFKARERLKRGENFKGYFVTMWDDSRPFDHDSNPYIFQMFKYGIIDGRPDATDCLFFAVISHGRFRDSLDHGYYVLGWDPNKTYRFRLEWERGRARVYRDGAFVGTVTVYKDFSPRSHAIQIGANLNNIISGRRKAGPGNLLISDVVIGTW
jgi:hypothetical protein